LSASSRTTGAKPVSAAKSADDADTGGPVEMALEHQRGRHLFWGGLGLLLGLFLLWRMGPFGLVAGAIVLLFSYPSVRLTLLSLRNDPGKIAVGEAEVVLPEGLCVGRTVIVPIGDVKHAYLLRRALPLMTHGPVLVVETARGTFEYPRDWFGQEGDQRRVAQALNRRLGRSH